jgi:hypothetical protein
LRLGLRLGLRVGSRLGSRLGLRLGLRLRLGVGLGVKVHRAAPLREEQGAHLVMLRGTGRGRTGLGVG